MDSRRQLHAPCLLCARSILLVSSSCTTLFVTRSHTGLLPYLPLLHATPYSSGAEHPIPQQLLLAIAILLPLLILPITIRLLPSPSHCLSSLLPPHPSRAAYSTPQAAIHTTYVVCGLEQPAAGALLGPAALAVVPAHHRLLPHQPPPPQLQALQQLPAQHTHEAAAIYTLVYSYINI